MTVIPGYQIVYVTEAGRSVCGLWLPCPAVNPFPPGHPYRADYMSCLSSARIAEIQAQIDVLNTQISAMNAALPAEIPVAGIIEYRFQSADGSQRVERRSVNDLFDTITTMEARRDRLQRQLNGTGIVAMTTRRNKGRVYG